MPRHLKKVFKYMKKQLNDEVLQELSDKCVSINTYCKGEGCGLLSGSLIDLYITNFLKKLLNPKYYKIFHKGECDMEIHGVSFSFKKITGKTCIALDWSKNKANFKKDYFTHDIIIMNLKSGMWWKKCNNTYINAGIYFVDKEYCLQNVKLSSNNKTNSLITDIFVYNMLLDCIEKNHFIPIPDHQKICEFDILKAFHS